MAPVVRHVGSAPRHGRTGPARLGALVLLGLGLSGAEPVLAQRIENQLAVFAALDKVTARISRLEIELGQTVTFGALRVTPRACYSRPPADQPKTTTFVEIDEVMLDGKVRRIFSGWMFAESPGLNAVEHPIFDLWLIECGQPARVATKGEPKAAQPTPATPPGRKRPPR